MLSLYKKIEINGITSVIPAVSKNIAITDKIIIEINRNLNLKLNIFQ